MSVPVSETYTVPDGTLPLLAGILQMMDFTHRDMRHLIADLPEEALAWRPAHAMGTLSGIVCHTMYCETFAIRRAAGEDVSYTEDENDETWRAVERREHLIARIAEGNTIMKRILPVMTVAGMEKRFNAWGGDATQSGGELIAEAAIHTGMHWGHMQMTRQLWEQAHPEFTGAYSRW